jgi:hypothetical protein
MPEVHNKYHETAPPGAVYIGRPSPWGNPFSVEEYGRTVALQLFKKWVLSDRRAALRDQARRELKGKDLVCFCKPKDCHGDIWIEIANSTPTLAVNTTTESNNEQQEDQQGSRAAGTY